MPRVEDSGKFYQPYPVNEKRARRAAVLPFFALVFFGILFLVHPAHALTYRVRKGDTLDRIARRYRISVEKLKRENGLSTSLLRPGRKLRILEARRGRRREKIKNKRHPRAKYARRARQHAKTHPRVRRIRHILRHRIRHKRQKHLRQVVRGSGHESKHVSARPAYNDNPVSRGGAAASSPDAGQKGAPVDSGEKAPAAAAPSTQVAGISNAAGTALMNATTSAIFNSIVREAARDSREAGMDYSHRVTAYRDRYHRVRRGETLFSIARRYGTTIKKLKRLNGMRSSKLRIGRRLLVSRRIFRAEEEAPGEYRVKKGDTFDRIAREFHLDAEKLMDINEMDSSDLRPGQIIKLSSGDESRSAAAEAAVSAPLIESKIKELQSSKTLQKLSLKDRLMLFAKLMLNIPYRFGGTSLYGIDCSALVQKVFRFLNIDLPRTARQQYKEGVPVSLDDLAIGDLVFFRTYASFPSHVGIYIGKNLFIHASSGGHRVKLGSLTTPYFMKRLIGAKRLLTGGGELPNPGSGK